MANKSKKSTTTKVSKSSVDTKITHIKASDIKPTASSDKKPVKKPRKFKKSVNKKPIKGFLRILVSIGGYFKGAWFELRQVHWPNRRATWSLTAAVLIFTAFFVVLVVLLDILFKYLFELILG